VPLLLLQRRRLRTHSVFSRRLMFGKRDNRSHADHFNSIRKKLNKQKRLPPKKLSIASPYRFYSKTMATTTKKAARPQECSRSAMMMMMKRFPHWSDKCHRTISITC
jgi:hypothetical protein